MVRRLFYKVAGLVFGVELRDDTPWETRLAAYNPFTCPASEDLLFTLSFIPVDDPPISHDWWTLLLEDTFKGVVTAVYTGGDGYYHYVLRLERKAGMMASVDFNMDFTDVKCKVHGDAQFQLFALNNALMLMYALTGCAKEALLFHASVIKHDGKGLLFVGKSGTGKSTHSKLWLNYVEGSELLNDDNPVVRIVDNVAWVFGSPWSGKTPCYKNEGVPVGGIVSLRQAAVNEVERLSVVRAYGVLLTSVSNMRWEKKCADAVDAVIHKLIATTSVFCLKNRPEKEAADMCLSALDKDSWVKSMHI